MRKNNPIMAETQLCGLCTNVEEETSFGVNIFDPNQPQLLSQIQKLIGQRLKRVLPQHIFTTCEEQTQAKQNFATQIKKKPKFCEVLPSPTEELASNEINLIKEEQENDEEDSGVLPSTLPLLTQIILKDEPLSPGGNYNTEDHDDLDNSYKPLDEDQRNSMVKREEKTEAGGMKLEEMNEASLPSYSEVKPPKKAKFNISKTEKNRQRKSIDRNCELCGKHFTLRGSLWAHMQQHKGEKKFKCDICPASFVLNAHLKQHKLRHTWEFGCGLCDRRFKQKNDLTNHERIHTKERPYVCPTCGKGFLYSRNLKAHMVIHTGVRAYKCETCNLAFKFKAILLTHYHTKKHKKNEEKLPTKLTN